MTRAEFSEKCDISESFLAAVESGKKSITSKTLYKICTALNVSADYFILGKNNDFKTDTALELLNSLDDFSRESAMQILNQYVIAINNVRSRNDSAKKPQTCCLGLLVFLWKQALRFLFSFYPEYGNLN